MRRLLILLASGLLVLGACGGDDDTVETSDDTSVEDTGSEDTGSEDTGSEDTGSDGEATEGTDEGPSSEAAVVPTSEEICAAITAPLEAIYGTATKVESRDSSYPNCDIDHAPARVVVSAFSVDEVGGDFDAYIENIGETVPGLEPLDGVGDKAVANDVGHSYVLLDGVIFTVSRVFNETRGDPDDIVAVTEAVATALAA